MEEEEEEKNCETTREFRNTASIQFSAAAVAYLKLKRALALENFPSVISRGQGTASIASRRTGRGLTFSLLCTAVFLPSELALFTSYGRWCGRQFCPATLKKPPCRKPNTIQTHRQQFRVPERPSSTHSWAKSKDPTAKPPA